MGDNMTVISEDDVWEDDKLGWIRETQLTVISEMLITLFVNADVKEHLIMFVLCYECILKRQTITISIY